jgi:hypothetical protein
VEHEPLHQTDLKNDVDAILGDGEDGSRSWQIGATMAD